MLVGWVAVKAGLGLYSLSKAVADPLGAVEDTVRGAAVADKRRQLARLKTGTGLKRVRVGPGPQGFKMVSGDDPQLAIARAQLEAELAELLAVEKEETAADEAQAPGIGMLKAADRVYGTWGPVLPAAVVGGNILMEFFRVRRERVGGTVP